MQELKKEHKEILEILFATNLEFKKLHMTSDGQAFTEEHRARAWAKELGDNEVTTHYRDQIEKVKEILTIVKDAVNGKGKKAGGFNAAFEQGTGTQGEQEPGGAPTGSAAPATSETTEEKTDSETGEGGEGQGEQGGDGSSQPSVKTETTEDPKAEIKAARLKYFEVTGKKATNVMTLEFLNSKIAEGTK